MDANVYSIIELLLKAAMIAVAVWVIPAVKQWLQENTVAKAVTDAVQAAQQLYNADNETKLDYATQFVKASLLKAKIEMSDEQIRGLIESAVWVLKNTSK